VWHGIQNLASTPSVVLNLVDRAYDYDDPDHRRLPTHTEQIPLRFA
jgi:dTDP-4-dehydrorhamnose 3,5-epimerase